MRPGRSTALDRAGICCGLLPTTVELYCFVEVDRIGQWEWEERMVAREVVVSNVDIKPVLHSLSSAFACVSSAAPCA